MFKSRISHRSRGKTRLLQAAAVLALLALALPAQAGDTRAVKSRVPPVYPELAKRMHVTGEVDMEVTVDAQGKVKDVKAVKGNHILAQAAQDALYKWKFQPGDGDAVVDVSLNFELNQ